MENKAIEQFANELKASSPDVREAAIEALGQMGPAAIPVLSRMGVAAVPAFVEALDDREMRWQAAIDLIAMGPAAIPVLRDALKDQNPHVRIVAACALGTTRLVAISAVPDLTEVLTTDKVPDARYAAAQALGDIAAALEETRSAMWKTLWGVVRDDAAFDVRKAAVAAVNKLMIRGC
jgi:HEAT repeat protein